MLIFLRPLPVADVTTSPTPFIPALIAPPSPIFIAPYPARAFKSTLPSSSVDILSASAVSMYAVEPTPPTACAAYFFVLLTLPTASVIADLSPFPSRSMADIISLSVAFIPCLARAFFDMLRISLCAMASSTPPDFVPTIVAIRPTILPTAYDFEFLPFSITLRSACEKLLGPSRDSDTGSGFEPSNTPVANLLPSVYPYTVCFVAASRISFPYDDFAFFPSLVLATFVLPFLSLYTSRPASSILTPVTCLPFSS